MAKRKFKAEIETTYSSDELKVMLNGNNIGITAHIRHNPDTNKDEILIVRTSGKNVSRKSEIIADFSE